METWTQCKSNLLQVIVGRDHTLSAKIDGIVKYETDILTHRVYVHVDPAFKKDRRTLYLKPVDLPQ